MTLNPLTSRMTGYSGIGWDWNGFSFNSSFLKAEVVEKYLNRPWNWSRLSQSSIATPTFVRAHPEKPWNRNHLAVNPFFINSDNYLEISKEFNLDFKMLAKNPAVVTEDTFEKHRNQWNWKDVRNHNCIINKFEEHPEWDWDWTEISRRVPLRTYEKYQRRAVYSLSDLS
jgi:hypothetical protein